MRGYCMNLFSSTHHRERFLLTLLLMVLGVAFTLSDGLKRWDLTLYDLFSTISYQDSSDTVLIIAIDENSLGKYGRWPWPRRVHASLINKLSEGGARAIGYDVIFSEANQYDPEDDVALADALARSKRVILPVFHEKVPGDGPLQLTLPLPMLMDAAAGLGHVDAELDPDGIVRRALLRSGSIGQGHPALVVSMLRLPGAGDEANDIGRQATIRTRYGDSPVYVSFTGPPGHFPAISFADFLQPDFPAEAVKNKFVLVGVTALGLGDSLPTPVSGKSIPMPGIEYNANLLSGLLNNTLIVPMAMKWRLLSAGLLALLPMLLYPFLSPRQSLFVVALLLFSTLSASLFLLHGAQIWFPPSAVLIVLGLSYPLWVWRRLEDTIVQLFREKERAQVILNSIGDGVIATDVSGRVEYMNPVAESLTGYPLSEARDRPLRDIFPVTSEDRRRDLTDIVERCLGEKQTITMQDNGFIVNRNDSEHAVRTSAGLLRNASGKAQGVVLGITDVTDTHKMMRQMAYQATHDLLTGLPNRSLLYDRLTQIIARAGEQKTLAAVFFIDLDQFKKVNDQIGHYGGDQLLKKVGARLRTCCSDDDILAHLGSDKFVIALNQVPDADNAARFADDLLRVLEAPFSMDGQDVYITCSIGICLYPKDGRDVDELLKNADTAMCRAKECGRNFYRFFSRAMNDRIHERLDIEQKLREALAGDELEIYYQPQVRARDGRLIGAESLMRWKNSEYGPISPARFIPVAEDCGLILPMGEWALQTVCRQAKSWQEVGLAPLRVAVNLSSKQFLYGNIYKMVSRALVETGLDPACLELEITESLIMEDLAQSTELLKELKQLGIRVSIDDFGTGYSSLSYLKHFPVDQLKIDQSFIHDIADKSGDEAITLAIITMAHGLGLGVIAEGVENQAQLAILRGQECDEIQGYFFSRPLSMEQMTQYQLEHPAA
ncbi:MAG TPA: EAL domain-containing protein [Desulfobulbaceae bacterium]|nr:EAL domain-containing protein [Desulfobulbaceae bacterium]